MVFIYDADAFERIAALEGAAWRSEQLRRPDAPYGFFAKLTAWNARAQSELRDDPDVLWVDFLPDGFTREIYGAGGYHRYVVANDGEIRFSVSHSRPENAERALAAGFQAC